MPQRQHTPHPTIIGAVGAETGSRKAPMTYVIALPCVDVKDRACVEECPVDCIYEGDRTLYIHPDECVDCGACEPVCPVEAIYYEDDVPEEWSEYITANAEFFDDLGSPGAPPKWAPLAKTFPSSRHYRRKENSLHTQRTHPHSGKQPARTF